MRDRIVAPPSLSEGGLSMIVDFAALQSRELSVGGDETA